MEASKTPAMRALTTVRRLGPASLAVLVLGLAGAVLLVVAELSSVVTINVDMGTCPELADPDVRDACDVSGFEQHGGALILLGVVGAVMTLGAARGGSRPAALALLVIAAIVLAFALLRDLPKAGETGLVGIRYEQAEAMAGLGLYLEIVGAVALAVAGLATLLRPRDDRIPTPTSDA
jgi:hypothetical protein